MIHRGDKRWKITATANLRALAERLGVMDDYQAQIEPAAPLSKRTRNTGNDSKACKTINNSINSKTFKACNTVNTSIAREDTVYWQRQ